jgi:N-acetylmuramic acid 6-phosphate etherase
VTGRSELRLTERRNPRSGAIDTASPLELVDLIAAEDATVPAAVAAARLPIAQAVERIEASFRAGGRLIYVGAGTSGRLGVLDATECPPTFGTPPGQVIGLIAGGQPALTRSVEGAEDDPRGAHAELDACGAGPRDTVVGIAASGTTPYVRGALEHARARGAATVLVTAAEPDPELLGQCDVAIVLRTGPEVVTGSTRMKAGTATKLVLNTLTTAALVRLGKTYGNLMVDLRAWNRKLEDRGERIVMEVAGVDRAAARAALAAADGGVRIAIVMAARGLGREAAEALLARHDQHLRLILGDPPPVPEAGQ